MTAVDTTPRPDLAPLASRGELVHESCCVDPDLAMCGSPAGGALARTADCVVCVDLLRQWAQSATTAPAGTDPTTRCRFCPKPTEAGR